MTSSDIELAEILAARLCHDLVGPIGAVSNGVELMADESAGADPEVTGLIAASARQAAQRLQCYRVAFGSGAALPEGALLAETRRIALALYEGARTPLEWPTPDGAAEAAATRLAAKVTLNLVLIASEVLPRGGSIHVQIAAATKRLTLTVAGNGPAARLPDDVEAALRPEMACGDVSPKAVPAYLAARLATHAGGSLAVRRPSNERIEFVVDLPGRN